MSWWRPVSSTTVWSGREPAPPKAAGGLHVHELADLLVDCVESFHVWFRGRGQPPHVFGPETTRNLLCVGIGPEAARNSMPRKMTGIHTNLRNPMSAFLACRYLGLIRDDTLTHALGPAQRARLHRIPIVCVREPDCSSDSCLCGEPSSAHPFVYERQLADHRLRYVEWVKRILPPWRW